MNPEQAHAILSSAASRALLNEADRFAVIQARDTLGLLVKEQTRKDAGVAPSGHGAPSAVDSEIAERFNDAPKQRALGSKLNGRTKR